MIYCRRYICIVCYCLPVNVCPSILVCNVKNQRIVLSDNSYRRYFISKCSKCKHSFSKQQNLIYFREPYLLIRYKHVDGEEKLLTILKREERRKKKGETRHFILHPFWKANSIIYTLWILPSGSLPEIPNIMLIWVHMTSLTNIKPPRSIVQLASKAHKQHGGTLCVCWGL